MLSSNLEEPGIEQWEWSAVFKTWLVGTDLIAWYFLVQKKLEGKLKRGAANVALAASTGREKKGGDLISTSVESRTSSKWAARKMEVRKWKGICYHKARIRWSGDDVDSVTGHLKDQIKQTFVRSDEGTVGCGLSKRMDCMTVPGLFQTISNVR